MLALHWWQTSAPKRFSSPGCVVRGEVSVVLPGAQQVATPCSVRQKAWGPGSLEKPPCSQGTVGGTWRALMGAKTVK